MTRTITATDARRAMRTLAAPGGSSAADLDTVLLAAVLDYVVHTRLRTPRNAWTAAAHRDLDDAQRNVLAAMRAAR